MKKYQFIYSRSVIKNKFGKAPLLTAHKDPKTIQLLSNTFFFFIIYTYFKYLLLFWFITTEHSNCWDMFNSNLIKFN